MLGWLFTMAGWFACGALPDDAQASRAVDETAPDAPLAWPDNPEELGRVRWQRGFEQAKAQAKASGKPLLVLFDEVPGCSTVLAYGHGTLSEPLVVDAIEQSFVPVVVYNNVAGPDRKVLEAYREPTWNNPVVRILDGDGKDLVPRLAGDYRPAALFDRMVTALGQAKRTVPDWLALVAQESTAEHTQTATYAMYCFWSGEEHLGAHDGVLATAPGFMGGREVVSITYDPRVTSKDRLDQWAEKGKALPIDGTFRASPKDDRYRLRHTTWRSVPMTPAQAARVNADLGAGRSPERWLSPRQLALHERAVASGDTRSAGLGSVSVREAFDRLVR